MEVIIINTWRLVLNLRSLHLQVLPEERTGSDQAQGSGPGTPLICNCSSGGAAAAAVAAVAAVAATAGAMMTNDSTLCIWGP